MRFAHPLFFLLLALIPLLVWYYLTVLKRRRGGLGFSDLSVIRRLRPSPLLRYRHAPLVLRAIVIGLAIAAMARPQAGVQGEEVTTEGIDIVLSVDISGSMRAEDFKPRNRLYVAKQVMAEFIKGRRSDRIGMVVFGGRSFTQCPLTLDYNVLLGLLDQIEIGMIEDGTAIGMGMANAINRLRQSTAKSKVVILLTDGVNNTGAIDPLTAAQAAKALGIKIHTVGVGREGGAPIPVDDPIFGKTYARNPDGSLMMTEIDEPTLREIADITDGVYFRATDAQTLADIYRRIDAMERTEIKTVAYIRYRELFMYFLLPALVLVLSETVLTHTRLRRLP
ncbi:MAG: VWA domain-containing protein [candidate division Zixibacteria bacterium]|nr:VWA domain-containing protein [candidate division Zixibacteria bacterium]